MADARDCLSRRIYYAARDGHSMVLQILLNCIDENELPLYLQKPFVDEGNKCTPLTIAVLKGHGEAAQMLLSKFDTSIEQESMVKYDDCFIEGATALWCASGAGHFDIVRNLVNNGADVNHSTRSSSTPLRHACFEGHLNIVEYLIENGAHINTTNDANSTCLMIASFKGHVQVVSYLIGKGADLDAKDENGDTAFHYAADEGKLEIIKIFNKFGAMIVRNNKGMTPLLLAATRTHENVVDFFIDNKYCSQLESVEALELIGASYATNNPPCNLEKAYDYLYKAMIWRTDTYIYKIPPKPIPVYGYHVECQSINELRRIQNNSDDLKMESLVTRERILGSNNLELCFALKYRGAEFADAGQYDRCTDLWIYVLKISRDNGVTISYDLLRLVQLFAEMNHKEQQISFIKVKQILEIVIERLINKSPFTRFGDVVKQIEEESEKIVYAILYMLVIITKIIHKLSPKEKTGVYGLVTQINKLEIKTGDGSTLLFLAGNAATPPPSDEFLGKYIFKFPSIATTDLLLNCAANTNNPTKKDNYKIDSNVKEHEKHSKNEQQSESKGRDRVEMVDKRFDMNHSILKKESEKSKANQKELFNSDKLRNHAALKYFDKKIIDVVLNELMDFSPNIRWDDVSGLEFVKKSIQEVVIWPLLRPDIFTGLRAPPRGILLFGPPGTGKTLIGKCIASESHSRFFSISASSLASKYVGESEQMVRVLFAAARLCQPAIIFIDEIDSLLSQRSEKEQDHTRKIKTEFLIQMDGTTTVMEEPVIVVGATNRPHDLDEAARRRFVKRLYVPLPCAAARKQIIKKLICANEHNLSESDLELICDGTEGYSGADVTNVCKEAAMGPIRSISMKNIQTVSLNKVRPISLRDFTDALRQVRASVVADELSYYVDWNKKFGSFDIL